MAHKWLAKGALSITIARPTIALPRSRPAVCSAPTSRRSHRTCAVATHSKFETPPVACAAIPRDPFERKLSQQLAVAFALPCRPESAEVDALAPSSYQRKVRSRRRSHHLLLGAPTGPSPRSHTQRPQTIDTAFAGLLEAARSGEVVRQDFDQLKTQLDGSSKAKLAN